MPYSSKREQTQNNIIDCFIELLWEKNISQISVRELCDVCHINRSTFYTYYLDLYDLLDQLENDIITSIQNDLDKTLFETNDIIIDKVMERILANFEKKNSILVLLMQKGNETFTKKMYQMMKTVVLSENTDLSKEDLILLDFCIRYHISAIVEIWGSWQRENDELDLEEVLSLVALVASEGPLTVLRTRFLQKK